MRLDYFVPDEILNHENPYIRESGGFIAKTSLLIAGITFLLGVNHWFTSSPMASGTSFALSFFILLNLAFFAKIGNLRLSAHILLLFTVMFLIIRFLVSGNFYPYMLIWIPCIPLYATCLLGKKETYIWTSIVVALIFVIYYMKSIGIEIEFFRTPKDKLLQSSALTIVFAMIITLTLVSYIRRKELSALKQTKLLEEKYQNLIHRLYFEGLPLNAKALAYAENIDFKWNERSEERNSHWMKQSSQKLYRSLKELCEDRESLKLPKDYIEKFNLVDSFQNIKNIFESTLSHRKCNLELLVEDSFSKTGGRLFANQAVIENLVLYPIFKYFVQSERNYQEIQVRLRSPDEDHITMEISAFKVLDTSLDQIHITGSSPPLIPLELDDSLIVSSLAIFGARIGFSERKPSSSAHSSSEVISIVFPCKS